VINPGDTISYSFPTPVTPSEIAPGWDGTTPLDCSPTPQPAGCATVWFDPDQRWVLTDSDTLKVFRDTGATDRIAALGTVDFADDDYTPLIPRSWAHSAMQLTDGGRKLAITLGQGANGPRGFGANTAIWSNPSCGCSVPESAGPAGEDRDF
jgi:hypothetical protein